MLRKPILIAITAIALVTLACGFTVDVPIQQIETGPMVRDDIEIEVPDSNDPSLEIAFGAGRLDIVPGAPSDMLVQGTARYNVENLAPMTSIDGDNILVQTGEDNFEFEGIPFFGENGDFENRWDLSLNNDTPMDLVINVGAGETDIELGGLSLNNLQVSQGAGDFNLDFSELNQVSMNRLTISGGAGNYEVSGLANANVDDFRYSGGAGNHTLIFSGDLQQDMTVSASSGVGEFTIRIPEDIAAEVTIDSGIAQVMTSGDWGGGSGRFSQPGEGGPVITIDVDMGAGNVRLTN